MLDRKKVEGLLERGDISAAIKLLKAFFLGRDEQAFNQLILLASQYRRADNQLIAGTISHQDCELTTNKVASAILTILNRSEHTDSPDEEAIPAEFHVQVADDVEKIKSDRNVSDDFQQGEVKSEKERGRNPYKFLSYYDIKDFDLFYGRREETSLAIETMISNFGNQSYPNMLSLTGQSGSGKSSVLRAGVLGKMNNSTINNIKFKTCTFRPTDFLRSNGKTVDVIPRILQLIEKQTGLDISTHEINSNLYSNADRALKLISNTLNTTDNTYLIIGVDQFEEIVDFLHDEEQYRDWYPIVNFMNKGAQSDNIGIIYTLESSRKTALKSLNIPSSFNSCEEVPIDGYSSNFIRSIVKTPFADAGYIFDKDVLRKLLDGISALQVSSKTHVNSILPIIGLKLYTLFEDLKINKPIPTDSESTVVTGDDIGHDYEFASIIEDQAKKAWYQATESLEIDMEKLDFFLQPLLSIGGPELDQIQLQVIDLPVYQDDKKLVDAFLQHRLLIRELQGIRLVHEVVIKYWPKAKEWFEKKKAFYHQLNLTKLNAKKWDEQGRPNLADSATTEDVDNAAIIMSANLRNWMFKKENEKNQDLLQDYCYHTFSLNNSPRRTTTYIETPTPFAIIAATHNQIELIKRYYQEDPSIISIKGNKNKRTMLFMAAWGHFELVKLLLKFGSDPAEKDKDGWPPIGAPIVMNRLDIFKEILRATKSPSDLESPNGGSMLHLCALNGCIEMADILVRETGLNPDQQDTYGLKPINYATRHGKLESFIQFENYLDVSIADHPQNLLHEAAAFGQISIIDYLLSNPKFEHRINELNTEGENALHIAAKHKQKDALQILLTIFDPNEKTTPANSGFESKVPLQLILENSNEHEEDKVYNCFRVLLNEPNVDPNISNSEGKTLYELASNFPKVQRLLLSDKRLKKEKSILFSILKEQLDNGISEPTIFETVDELLDAGVTIADYPEIDSDSPIVKAIHLEYWDLIRKLLESGGDSLNSSNWSTIITTAAFVDTPLSIIDEINSYNPYDLTLTNQMGWNLLHWFAYYDCTTGIDWLKNQPMVDSTMSEVKDHLERTPQDLRQLRSQPLNSRTANTPLDWDHSVQWADPPADLIEQLKRAYTDIDQRYDINEDTEILISRLSFYEDVSILRLTSQNWLVDSLAIYFLHHADHFIRLDGTSPPIHQVNGRAKLILNESTVLDYLRFFCFFVRGDSGPFFIAENINQAGIPVNLLSQAERTELDTKLVPALHCGYIDETSTYLATAMVYYGKNIFVSEFEITTSGMVRMEADFLRVQELSHAVNLPVS